MEILNNVASDPALVIASILGFLMIILAPIVDKYESKKGTK